MIETAEQPDLTKRFINNSNNAIVPGVYDITNEEYHSSPGISSSGINLFLKSPRHYYDKYLAPDREKQKSTPAMIIGSAFHCYVLEPNKFDDEYIVAPVFASRKTKIGKTEYNNFLTSSNGKTVLSKDDMETIKKMAESVMADELAATLINNARVEKSIYWIDEGSGLLCKCRPDIWHENAVGDLKTTDDASKQSFKYSIKKFGYHIQTAMYLDGVSTVSNSSHSDFVHIVVEKSRPFLAQTYMLHDDEIRFAQNKYKDTLLLMKECIERNYWPGYHIGTEEISLSF